MPMGECNTLLHLGCPHPVILWLVFLMVPARKGIAEQLRHKWEKTTLRYDQAPVEERKKALDKMG